MPAFRYGATENPAQRSFQKGKYLYSQREKSSDKAGFRLPSILARAPFFESLLCSPQWCLHLEAGSSPPGHKVAARNNCSISRKRKDCIECPSNHSSRLCTQTLVTCSLLNQILAREKALPLHYSSGVGGWGEARFPSDTWLQGGRRVSNQIRALLEGEGELLSRP